MSPVNAGDCVAARIEAKRTAFVDELAKIYCARNKPDTAKEKKCVENSKLQGDFIYFTDRCSEDNYFIGLDGEEVRLKRISQKPGRPHDFIGSFAGRGVRVEISHPRLIKKTVEDNLESGAYHVLVTVKKGSLKKTFKGVLSYGF